MVGKMDFLMKGGAVPAASNTVNGTKDEETIAVAVDGQTEAYMTSPERRQLGITSAIFLVFNRMVGTGIFATPSEIVRLSGSVGLSLVMWVVGVGIACAGAAVYLEFGTGLPRNGGEKNYLEYVFRRPKFLATAMYASWVMLLGWAGANSVMFGEYILHAADVEVNRWNQRAIGMGCITTAFLIHGLALNWGVRLQNALGIIKLAILVLIVISGFVALGGHVKLDQKPDNFTSAFQGTTASAYGIVTALYNVIWSLMGYNNANYALAETKNPVRTLKIALPAALGLVSILYILVNVAYFAAVPKEEIVTSGRILAASFFRNVVGRQAERALSVFVALSAFGNVLGVIFSNGRLVQEIGREGILPFSRFWSSNKPCNAPFVGLFEHWLVSVIVMLGPPPGDAYNFILNLISYPMSIVNVFVSIALIHLYFNPFSIERDPPRWAPPFRATLPVAIFFLLANLFLVIAPYVPPDAGQEVYAHLPYYLHCLVGVGIFVVGLVYWTFWARILPKIGKYDLVRENAIGHDGWTHNIFVKRPKVE
ncbi:probable low-affinity methionine permease [Rhynchosporium graminicola]|uniref:Probable low-affinity methionine permease n=1 Tax=Rhynchosporium graminicola TaxID=2792576 RepID=A0A1E1LMH9_9HELO|nr:probable low-affinity methionine permease [Rhynchosporium commune]